MRIFRAEWISLCIKIQFNSLGINRTDFIANEKILEKPIAIYMAIDE